MLAIDCLVAFLLSRHLKKGKASLVVLNESQQGELVRQFAIPRCISRIILDTRLELICNNAAIQRNHEETHVCVVSQSGLGACRPGATGVYDAHCRSDEACRERHDPATVN